MAEDNKSGLNILTELYAFYHRLSELSYIYKGIAYHCDMGWAFLECYKDDDDKELWTKLVENAPNMYMQDLNKVVCISLLLYKYRAINTVSYKNRIHEKYTDKYKKNNIEFIDRLDYKTILIRHKQLQQIMTKNEMDIMFHLDLGIAMLQPYFTEEDAYKLEMIARQSPYTQMVQKEMLSSIVMDRAEMLFSRGMIDRKGGKKWVVGRD